MCNLFMCVGVGVLSVIMSKRQRKRLIWLSSFVCCLLSENFLQLFLHRRRRCCRFMALFKEVIKILNKIWMFCVLSGFKIKFILYLCECDRAEGHKKLFLYIFIFISTMLLRCCYCGKSKFIYLLYKYDMNDLSQFIYI